MQFVKQTLSKRENESRFLNFCMTVFCFLFCTLKIEFIQKTWKNARIGLSNYKGRLLGRNDRKETQVFNAHHEKQGFFCFFFSFCVCVWCVWCAIFADLFFCTSTQTHKHTQASKQANRHIHTQTKGNVAIKMINKKSCDNTLLHNEVQILKKINHPNIVKLFDLLEFDGYLYLVMEKLIYKIFFVFCVFLFYFTLHVSWLTKNMFFDFLVKTK